MGNWVGTINLVNDLVGMEDGCMKSNLNSSFYILILLLLFVGHAQASNIVEITVDELGIPFVLDDEGHVWGFRKPFSLEEPVKLPHLEHIKKIAPYIAIDADGRVFTWGIKDSLVQEDQNSIAKAGYTAPKRVENLQGVTMVAHSLNHFFAVINNQEIVEWLEIRKKRGYEIESYGPIRKIISRAGVKAIAASPGEIERVVAEPYPYGLVALFDDGTVMGWGITSTGQIVKEAATPSIELTKSPWAIGIAMNAFHTVILSAQGVPQFWGGCDLYGRGLGGRPWKYGHVQGVDGYVTDVKGMALAQHRVLGPTGWGSDNDKQDVFIKHDGTVWLAYAPIPENTPGFECSQDNRTIKYRQAQQLLAGKAAAVQVAVGWSNILMLDADHNLWLSQGSYMHTEFRKVMINLK